MKRMVMLFCSVLFLVACAHQEPGTTPVSGSMGTNSGYGGSPDTTPWPGSVMRDSTPDWNNGPGSYGPNSDVATGTSTGAQPAQNPQPVHHHRIIP